MGVWLCFFVCLDIIFLDTGNILFDETWVLPDNSNHKQCNETNHTNIAGMYVCVGGCLKWIQNVWFVRYYEMLIKTAQIHIQTHTHTHTHTYNRGIFNKEIMDENRYDLLFN